MRKIFCRVFGHLWRYAPRFLNEMNHPPLYRRCPYCQVTEWGPFK